MPSQPLHPTLASCLLAMLKLTREGSPTFFSRTFMEQYRFQEINTVFGVPKSWVPNRGVIEDNMRILVARLLIEPVPKAHGNRSLKLYRLTQLGITEAERLATTHNLSWPVTQELPEEAIAVH